MEIAPARTMSAAKTRSRARPPRWRAAMLSRRFIMPGPYFTSRARCSASDRTDLRTTFAQARQSQVVAGSRRGQSGSRSTLTGTAKYPLLGRALAKPVLARAGDRRLDAHAADDANLRTGLDDALLVRLAALDGRG